jgi:NDP-sugar pyrophosphorylase family protein
MNSPVQIVIPAAGAGSRFKEAGIDTPKPMISVGGIPMILWVINNFSLRADDNVFIICQRVNSMPALLAPYLTKFDFKVHFIEIDGLTSGPASTVELALPRLAQDVPVIVANSDQYISHSISDFVNSIRNLEHSGTILTMNAHGNKWSYIGRNENGDITEVVEKREISNEATVGVYAWANPELVSRSIRYLKEENILVNNEFYVAPSYGYLVAEGLSIGVFSVGNHGDSVHGLGTPEDLNAFIQNPKFKEYFENIAALSEETN